MNPLKVGNVIRVVSGRVDVLITAKDLTLVFEERTLKKESSLAAQGISPNQLLWLQVEMRSFSTSDPVSGSLQKAVFRSVETELPVLKEARKLLMSRLHEKGIGY